jgi:Ca-activated chloride channel family protein
MNKTGLLLLTTGLFAVSCSMGNRYCYDAFPPYISNPGNGSEDVVAGDHFKPSREASFVSASEVPVSSFSVDADGASYSYMRYCVNAGLAVPASSVRIEEYLNYFTFDYDEPTGQETLGINAELGPCPWAPAHRLIRLGLKGKSMTPGEIPAANYILLVDVSGSMYGKDRIDLVKSGLCSMVDNMRPNDRIAIITYSGNVQMLLESTLISEGKSAIKAAIRSLTASGATAGGEAMKMAYEEASHHYAENGNNRIIMCTDGDFNVGVSSTQALVAMIEKHRDKGIYLSIMGFGSGNYQDSRMESISNKGNGTYNYIDSEEEMVKVFVNERSHFWAVANDTKCQVRFNPDYVDRYRLIGYDNRTMTSEQFENDATDAGEIGAGQTVTALYEIILKDVDVPADSPAPAIASFEARYKKAIKDKESRSLTQDICWGSDGQPSENLYFAAGVTAYGMVLKQSKFKGEASLSMARELVNGARTFDPDGFRSRFLELIDKQIK